MAQSGRIDRKLCEASGVQCRDVSVSPIALTVQFCGDRKATREELGRFQHETRPVLVSARHPEAAEVRCNAKHTGALDHLLYEGQIPARGAGRMFE